MNRAKIQKAYECLKMHKHYKDEFPSINVLLDFVEEVLAIQGSGLLPAKRECSLCDFIKPGSMCECRVYNEAIDEMALRYAANMPTRAILPRLNENTGGKDAVKLLDESVIECMQEWDYN